jgi:hypothetical protein
MKGSLKGRLIRLKELSANTAALPRTHRHLPPEGWEEISANVYTRRVYTGLILPDSARQRGFSASAWIKNPVCTEEENRISYSEACFLDLETTGLSGGAGTVAFLAGLGFFEGLNFVVEQVFIDDFPGEMEFLNRSLATLKEFSTIISFNGACFDLPLLKSRCVMNNLPFAQNRHIDALKMARRFWKGSFASCSLQSLEEEVLEKSRMDDIPGFLIPRIWLDYGKSESSETMFKVFEHNVRDIQSLSELFICMDRILEDPVEAGYRHRVNIPRLVRVLMDQSRVEEGLNVLRCFGADGDQGALRMLARYCRRIGDHDGYVWAVTSLGNSDWKSCIEKAKFYEHEKKDFLVALEHSVKGAELAAQSVRLRPQLADALKKRICRLEEKIAGRYQGESARRVSPN